MGKFLQKPSLRGTQFWFKCWHVLLLTLLKGSFAEREGKGTTIFPVNVLLYGKIDQPIWKLDTKKYLPAFNTGGSSEGTLDISLPV